MKNSTSNGGKEKRSKSKSKKEQKKRYMRRNIRYDIVPRGFFLIATISACLFNLNFEVKMCESIRFLFMRCEF